MSRFEKIFVIASIAVIVSFIGLYGYRFVHYYKIYSVVEETGQPLYEHIIMSSSETLYKNEDDYYFKGEANNNYVLYSGKLWRIVDLIDGRIKLVTDESITSLAFGESYTNSIVRKWLNPSEEENNGIFYYGIDVNYIDFMDVCIDEIDETAACDKTEEDLVGLLSAKDFNAAGGVNSYLNNGTNYWLSNHTSNGNLYVTEKGIKTSSFNSNESYGVRPVIILSSGVIINSGDGTIDNPYIIETRTVNDLGDVYPGEYVSFNNYEWRVISVGDNVSLALKEPITNMIFSDKTSDFDVTNKNSLAAYLDKYNNELVLNTKFYNGKYDGYNYLSTYNDYVETNVGLLSIGDMFNSTYDNIFLMNKSTSKSIYTITNHNLYADDITKELGVVPVVRLSKDLSIISGDGYKTPYVIGGVINEEN